VVVRRYIPFLWFVSAATAALAADEPGIVSIRDVPADGGGLVEIQFDRSDLDQSGSPTPIAEYEVHRRVDGFGTGPGGWEVVGTVAAIGWSSYATVAPTVVDSAGSGVRWTSFFVRAVSGAGVFFDSPPDSGYSVDNPPGPLIGLVLDETGYLFWDASVESDFRSFRVYGGDEELFSEGVQLIAETPQSMYDVRGLPFRWFFVTVTDAAGQEGPPARAASSLEQVPYSGDGLPPLFLTPHPFRSTTIVSYRIPTAGSVTIRVYDALGRRLETLIEDEWHAAQRHELAWRPTSAMGMFVIRVEAPGFEETKKVVRLR
jgi:hypothetical protein